MTHKFDDGRISKQASSKWYPLNSETQETYVELIHRSVFSLNDEHSGFSSAYIDKGFTMERQPKRILNYKNRMQTAVTFEMSLIQTAYTRQVITVLDMLGDIGGLLVSVGQLSLFFVKVFNYRSSYMHLA